MNKQEAIEKINYIETLNINDKTSGKQFDMVIKNQVLDIINQIDEPQKPKVPQFVADWYEEHKDNFEYSIQCLCVHGCLPVRKIQTWFDNEDNKPIETLVMMHKFGYKVKKEKLYTVELPNPNGGGYIKVYLGKYQNGKVGLYEWNGYSFWKQEEKAQLTEAEIKEDFAWLWQFAEEVKDNE